MKEPLEKPSQSETKKATRKRGGKPGRKSSKTKPRKAPAGRGAIRLRDSANNMVGEQSDAIIQALINKTKAGDATVAHLLVELTGGPKAASGKKKRKGPSWAEILANEPEWDPSMVKSVSSDGAITVLMDGTILRDASKLPGSNYDLADDEEDE